MAVSGAFVQTMVLTDVATGWTECIPIVVREAEMVVHALGRARELFPFPLRGVDFDNKLHAAFPEWPKLSKPLTYGRMLTDR
jgi:hypothetical protein